MLNEFCLVTGATETEFKQKWEEYELLIFKYAPLEDRRAIKKLLTDYKASASDSEFAGTCMSYKYVLTT